MKRNLIITLQLIKYSPTILFRYFKYLILKRQLIINDFRPNNTYCIEGTLNQLIWNVENTLFSIIENSSKVYLNSGDFIFKIDKEKTHFSLKSYGYNKTIVSSTNIKVVVLKQKSFESNALKDSVSVFKNYNPRLIHKKNINNGLRKVRSFSSIKFKPISISNTLNNAEFLAFKEPIKELADIDNCKTIDQLNYHQNE